MINLKKLLAKILQWMKSPVLHNSVANTNTFYRAMRDDTNVSVEFGVGSGGTNHGIWSDKLNKWLLYGDSTNVYVDNKIMPTVRTVVNTKAYQGTKSNAWEYVGASFTVPSGHYYLVVAIQGYASGRPIGIGLGTATDQNPPIYIATSSSTSETLYRGTFLLTGNSTYYLFTKRATVPTQTNNYNVYAIDFDL